MSHLQIEKTERWYLLPVSTGCGYHCDFCPQLGMKTEGKELAGELARARLGEYDRIAINCNVLFESGGQELIRRIQEEGWPIVIRVSETLAPADFNRLSHLVNPNKVTLEYIFSNWSPEVEARVGELEQVWKICQYTWVVNRNGGLLGPFEALPKSRWGKLRFYFPYKQSPGDRYYSAAEVARVLEDLSLRFPGLNILPPEHYEIHHPESDPGRDMDPAVEPSFKYKTSMRSARVSYVIPTFNNVTHLLTTLKNLVRQKTDHLFEVIVVDDGSSDGTESRVTNWIKQQKLECGFAYIYLPRPSRRKMGDSQFRAGIARNLGVKWAEGEILCFLDSDILVPPTYTDHLVEAHQGYDLIQPRRIQVQKRFSNGGHLYEDLIPGEHTQEKKNGYWEVFQSQTADWNQIHLRWRYVSTFCLSIKSDHFKRLGWFRRTFLAYGFEDTDLGLRAARSGLKFYLSPVKVFHLHHPLMRSEYFHSAFFKDLLLSRSVRTFFLNNLDYDIFKALEIYFDRKLLKNKWKDKVRGRLQIDSARRWNQYLLGREES
ncbi:MAG: glycosyltransferase family 2 protein [Bdellovibrionaceae bacterium]|nr:glycosyltransferase family 2 protein [Bdellovibrionales bacterium]MCB9086175.1 glycosyltransferase family 2 protein [Pseudobdellovibrionaceae bacterium]